MSCQLDVFYQNMYTTKVYGFLEEIAVYLFSILKCIRIRQIHVANNVEEVFVWLVFSFLLLRLL